MNTARRTVVTVLLVGTVVLGLSSSGLLAHHSFDAEYDAEQTVTLTGIVTKVDWINPHAYIHFDTEDDGNEVKTFRLEMGPPYALGRNGWTSQTVKIGDVITVTNAARAKDGSHAVGSMHTTSLTTAAGKQMVTR